MNSKQIIFRNDSKSLSICNRVRIFEGEKNVDCFEFMIPSTYNNIDLTKCDIVLVYITPDGIEHNLLINDYKQSEVYKKFNVYLIDIDERFTSIAGELKLYLKFTSSQNSKDIILETSSATIDLDKVPSGESGITPEKQDVIDQILLRSQEAINIANSIVERANSGEFNGKPGEKGDPGENGKDYVLTKTDKVEIAKLTIDDTTVYDEDKTWSSKKLTDKFNTTISTKAWKLIREIEVTEELGAIEITTDKDGNVFEVEDIYVEMINVLGTNGGNLGIQLYPSELRPATYVGGVLIANPISSTTKRHFFVKFLRFKGLKKYWIEAFGKNATGYGNTYAHNQASNSVAITDDYKVRNVRIHFSNLNKITAGTIKVYGR